MRAPFEKIREAALARGGACLSAPEDYSSKRTKLRWRCGAGHEWLASWDSVGQGHWCANCAGIARITLADFHRVASSMGGQCLISPDAPFNARIKVRWKCGHAGHEPWSASYDSVRAGNWCKACAGQARPSFERLQQLARWVSIPWRQPSVRHATPSRTRSSPICCSRVSFSAHRAAGWSRTRPVATPCKDPMP